MFIIFPDYLSRQMDAIYFLNFALYLVIIEIIKLNFNKQMNQNPSIKSYQNRVQSPQWPLLPKKSTLLY